MDIFLIRILNALLYASVLFLIAGGLSLVYGVMRIVNLAHGSLYAIDRGEIIFHGDPGEAFENEDVMKTIRGCSPAS